MAEKYLAKFKSHVNVGLGYDARKKAEILFKGLSKEDLKKAVDNINRYKTITLEVGLKADGDFEILMILDPEKIV